MSCKDCSALFRGNQRTGMKSSLSKMRMASCSVGSAFFWIRSSSASPARAMSAMDSSLVRWLELGLAPGGVAL